MVSTYTPNKRIEQPAHNDYVDSWDIPVNADWAIIDLALGSGVNLNLTGLSGNQGLAAAQYQPLKLIASGSPTAAVNLVIPAGVGGLWVVRNNVTTFVVTISSAAGGAAVTVPANTNTLVTCDGSATGMFLAINTPPPAGGLPAQIQINNTGILGGDPGLTWISPTLNTTGLNNTGSTVLGDTVGDTLTINGTALSAPNGLNINLTQLRITAAPYNQVMINAAAPYGSSALTVGGVITSTAGGYYFPDGTNQTSATTIPAGCIMAYAGPSIPTGWFHCFGQTLSRATWPALFAALGGAASPYGLPDANTFNLPDLRGRVIAEVDGGSGRLNNAYFPGGDSSYVGQTGGYDAVTYSTLITELFVRIGYWDFPAQSSTGYCSGNLALSGDTGGVSEGGTVFGLQFGGSGQAAQAHTHAVGGIASGSLTLFPPSFGAYGTTDDAYRNTDTRTNVQPTMVMYWIIKA